MTRRIIADNCTVTYNRTLHRIFGHECNNNFNAVSTSQLVDEGLLLLYINFSCKCYLRVTLYMQRKSCECQSCNSEYFMKSKIEYQWS